MKIFLRNLWRKFCRTMIWILQFDKQYLLNVLYKHAYDEERPGERYSRL